MERENADEDLLSANCEIDGFPTLPYDDIICSYPTVSDSNKSSLSGKRKAISDSSSSSSGDSSDPEKSPEQSEDESSNIKDLSPTEQVESESERLPREDQVVVNLEKLLLSDLDTFNEESILDDDKNVPRNSEGDTLLHLLFICMEFSYIRPILKSESITRYVRVQNDLFQTVLHLAVNSKINAPIDIIHGLFQAGADPKIQDIYGRTFLHIICENADHATLSAVCFTQTNATYGCKQIQGNIRQCIDMQNYDGQTALQIAVIRGSGILVRILVSLGADVNIRDRKSGRTALHFAAEKGDLDIVKTLINCSNVDIGEQTYNKESALVLAYYRKQDSIVRYLEETDAKCNSDKIKASGSVRRKFPKTAESQFHHKV